MTGTAWPLVCGPSPGPRPNCGGCCGEPCALTRAQLRRWLISATLPPDLLAALGVTAWVAQLDPATGELRYASAGHPMPLVCKPGGEATFLSPRRGAEGRPGGGGGATTDVPPGGVLVLYPGTATRPRDGDSTVGSQRRLADLAGASVMAWW